MTRNELAQSLGYKNEQEWDEAIEARLKHMKCRKCGETDQRMLTTFINYPKQPKIYHECKKGCKMK